MKKLYTLILLSVFAVSTTFSADLTDVKIYINPGHGGYDANDRNVATIPFPLGDNNGFYESKSNLTKGLYLSDKLQAANATVIMSRVSNTSADDRSLTEIAEEANANNVDAFLSIHSNAIGNNTGTNYLLLLYHGNDNLDPNNEEDSLRIISKSQATKAWPRLVDNPLTIWTHYTTSTNIRGDFSFYGNTSGLGVLRPLTVPGFLSEGSFHDYMPETHRLLNLDYCKLEGERFYKYYCDYFNADLPQTGTISGWVKGKDQRLVHPLYTYKAATDDQWLPLNGAEVKLKNEAGDLLSTYTVDDYFNGIYVFRDLAPGTYKLSFTAADHNPIVDTTVVVTAAKETAMKVLMYNPDLPLYKEIPPDYPNPTQDPGVVAMSNYNFNKDTESDLSWLNSENIRKVAYRNDKLYVLTEEPKIHVVNANTFAYIKELDLTGVSGGVKILSDINFTSDGYLLAINKDTISLPENKGREMKVYTWDDDDSAPRVLYTSTYQGQWFNGVVGETFAVSGARWKHKMYVPSVTTGSSKQIRIMGLLYEDEVPLGYRYMISPEYTEGNWGEKFKFTLSPNDSDKIIIDGENILPTEYMFDWTKPDRDPLYNKTEFAEVSGYELKPIASGSTFFRNAGNIFMASPNSNADASSVGVVLFDITNGLDNAKKISEFLPQTGLGSTPSPYMFAAGKVRNYDLDLIVLAEKQGAQLFSSIAATGKTNVYASELRAEEISDGYKLHFTLNENITSGEINILNGENVVHTIPLGALSKGINSVDLMTADISEGGTFNWSVTVSGELVDRPVKFTDNANPLLQFYSPRGVAVDNSFESPYFGRVYVSETVGGEVTSRATKDGVYILNSPLDDITAQGVESYAGNVAWGAGSSPMRLAVAPDGKVFVTDWSDSNSGVWVMDPANPSNPFVPVFSPSLTKATSGLSSNSGVNVHGSISHCYVLGTGADTRLYTFDEDYVDAVATSPGNLLQYNIGNLDSPWEAAPSSIVYNDFLNGNLQQNMNSCIAPDGLGGWWISQYRATDASAIPSLIHVNEAGNVNFNSGFTPTLIGSSYTGGMAVTEDGMRLAIGGPANEVRVFDITYNAENIPTLTLRYAIKPAMGNNTVGLSFDRAENLYIISNNSERLGVWALPKSENTFTTPAPSIQTIIGIGTGVPEVNDVKEKPTISVYPNPVSDMLNIKSTNVEVKSVEVYDINGRLMKQQPMSGFENTLSVSELSSGAYILRLKTDNGVETMRILKK